MGLELAQQLRALAAPPEDPGSSPSPYMSAPQASVTPVPRGPNALFWPLWEPHVRGAQTHVQVKHQSENNSKL